MRWERWAIPAAAAVLTALGMLMAPVAHAQPTGTIRGCVSFPREKGPMPPAIEVRGIGGDRWVDVEPGGSMVIEGVSPGDYRVEMGLFGYNWVRGWVRVLPSRESHIEIRFDERVPRLPALIPTEFVMMSRVAHVHDIRFGPGKVQWKSGEELGRSTRSFLFGAPTP